MIPPRPPFPPPPSQAEKVKTFLCCVLLHTIHKHTEIGPATRENANPEVSTLACSFTGRAGLPSAGGQCGGPYLRAVQGTVWGRRQTFKSLQPGANKDSANASAYCIWEILYLQGTDGGQ